MISPSPAGFIAVLSARMKSASRHYIGQSGRRYHEEKRAIPESAIAWVARLRAEKLGRFIGGSDVVFEFGVGSGWNLAEVRCKRRLGFDVSEFLAPTVRQLGVEWISATDQIPSDSIDVAICHHALEHVSAPAAALNELLRVLRPEGRLLLFTPFEREARYKRFDRAEPNHHLYSWNVQTLGNLVEQAGFEVSSAGIGRFGYDRFAAVWASKLGLGERGFRFLRGLAHIARPAFEVRITGVKRQLMPGK